MRPSKEPEFWVINTATDRDIHIEDLGLTIKAQQRKNLLHKRNDFTLEQLKTSAESGSISKSKYIVVRELLPTKFIANPPMVLEVAKPKEPLKPLRHPSFKNIHIPRYEELDFEEYDEEEMRKMEEQYAAEQAELAAQDRAPSLAVDKKYKEQNTNDEEDE